MLLTGLIKMIRMVRVVTIKVQLHGYCHKTHFQTDKVGQLMPELSRGRIPHSANRPVGSVPRAVSATIVLSG